MRRFDLPADPLHLALPRHHPLAGRENLRLEDLRGGVVDTDRPPPAPAPGTSSAPATQRALSRASPSRATTTRRCRAWSPPGVGRGADPPAGALQCAKRHSHPRPAPAQPDPQGLRGHPTRGCGDTGGGDDARRPSRGQPDLSQGAGIGRREGTNENRPRESAGAARRRLCGERRCRSPLRRGSSSRRRGGRADPIGVSERRDIGRVDLVAVDGDVAHLHVLLAHPQRDERGRPASAG